MMLMAKITQNKYMAATFIDKNLKDYIQMYMMKITEDPEISIEAGNWCLEAEEDDIYIFREGTIIIVEDGE